MTDSTTYPASDLPPNVQIAFRDDIDLETQPELRRTVERSVATHVAHSAEAVARVRAAEAERAKLMAALNAPLMKLIEEDPAAIKALEELRTRQYINLDSPDVLRGEQPLTATNNAATVPLGAARILAVPPPYDFSWSWFNQGGGPPFDQRLDQNTGWVGLVARSDPDAGGASGFVEAHAGFGLIVGRTDRTVTAKAHSSRSMRFNFRVWAGGLGSNVTSEGGMDFAAFEDGRLLSIASAKMWRRRVSIDEYDEGGAGPFEVHEPREISFTMRPGHEYTFNVGVWVYSDRTPAIGGALAQALIEGEVLNMVILTPPF